MKKTTYYIAAGLLTFMSVSYAAESAQKTDVTELLKSRLGGSVEVSEPMDTPVEGVYQTQFGSK